MFDNQELLYKIRERKKSLFNITKEYIENFDTYDAEASDHMVRNIIELKEEIKVLEASGKDTKWQDQKN